MLFLCVASHQPVYVLTWRKFVCSESVVFSRSKYSDPQRDDTPRITSSSPTVLRTRGASGLRISILKLYRTQKSSVNRHKLFRPTRPTSRVHQRCKKHVQFSP